MKALRKHLMVHLHKKKDIYIPAPGTRGIEITTPRKPRLPRLPDHV
jgi:hypothetical protein